VSHQPLTLKVTFVERPEVTIKGIDKLKIDKKDPKADAKDVQRVIDSVLGEHRTFAMVDRAAAEGDQIVVHFTGKDAEGKEVQGLAAQSYPVIIGSARLLPGFEPQLVGLKKGDAKSFTLTMPDTYGVEELRGKKVTFDVTAQRVEQVKMPTLDGEFAKKNLNAETAAAFRAMVEESILNQERQYEAMRRERALLDEIRNRTQVDLAPELLEEETKSVIEDLQHQLREQGKTLDDWLKQQNKTPEQAMEDLRKQAQERATLRLGIATLIDERKVELTEEEKRQAIDEAMAQFPPDQKKDAEELMRPGTDLYAQAIWQGLVRKMLGSFLA
jgi:trigger factor